MFRFMLALGLMISIPGYAVMIAGSDGTANTSAPTGDQGWSYVGRINTAPSSTTYLSNNWFITAYHVRQLDNPTGVSLNGSSYTIDSSTWTRLLNPDDSGADLIMFRVNETVSGVSGLSVVSSSYATGTALTLIGNGLNRGAAYYDGFGNPNEVDGYYYGSGTSKRWGSNSLEQETGLFGGIGYGSTYAFTTDFDNVDGEAHGVTYDSGGGVFVQDGGSYDLAGIMIASESATNSTGRFAAFGFQTIIADLAVYQDQINSTIAIPEPAVAALIGIFGVGTLVTRRLFS